SLPRTGIPAADGRRVPRSWREVRGAEHPSSLNAAAASSPLTSPGVIRARISERDPEHGASPTEVVARHEQGAGRRRWIAGDRRGLDADVDPRVAEPLE